MRKYFGLTNNDLEKVAAIADKIYTNRDRIVGKLISWESLTIHYFNFDLPSDELEHKDWVNSRPHWIVLLNKEFIKRNNACRLNVVHGQGLELLINKAMVGRHITDSTKKATNCLKTITNRTDEMITCDTEGKNFLRMFNNKIKGTLIYLYGEVSLSKLPNEWKKELMKLIKKNLPPEQGELFS